MRHLFVLSALVLFLVCAFTTTTCEGAVSADVQAAIDKIKALGGQCTFPGDTIKTITFTNGSDLNAEIFDLFAKQSDLESLQITDYRDLNDVDVAKLTGLKNLKTLVLTNSRITDAALKTIAEAFPDLVSLDVAYSTQLTNAATREIAKLQQLETLNVRYCDFSDFGMMNIAKLPKLKILDIRANMQVGDGGLGTLAKLPALRNLKHRGTSVTDAGMQSLVAAKTLDTLEIQDFAITGQSGQYIRQMEKLTSLIIFRCESFDSSGVLALEGLKLHRLTLRGLPIDNEAMKVFSGLPTLKRLYLNELSSISDAGIRNLESLKDLELLEIWESPITDESLGTIAKLASLKTLIIRVTDITDAGLEKLLAMPKLESVTLADNPRVTPGAIQKLRAAGKFKVLPEK
jgi:ribosomal protein L15